MTAEEIAKSVAKMHAATRLATAKTLAAGSVSSAPATWNALNLAKSPATRFASAHSPAAKLAERFGGKSLADLPAVKSAAGTLSERFAGTSVGRMGIADSPAAKLAERSVANVVGRGALGLDKSVTARLAFGDSPAAKSIAQGIAGTAVVDSPALRLATGTLSERFAGRTIARGWFADSTTARLAAGSIANTVARGALGLDKSAAKQLALGDSPAARLAEAFASRGIADSQAVKLVTGRLNQQLASTSIGRMGLADLAAVKMAEGLAHTAIADSPAMKLAMGTLSDRSIEMISSAGLTSPPRSMSSEILAPHEEAPIVMPPPSRQPEGEALILTVREVFHKDAEEKRARDQKMIGTLEKLYLALEEANKREMAALDRAAAAEKRESEARARAEERETLLVKLTIAATVIGALSLAAAIAAIVVALSVSGG